MADPMKIRANLVGDSTEVKVLMSHEMETGQRKDTQGNVIPAWFIQNVTATYNGNTVLSAQWGPAVAKNPFVSFKFKGGASGTTPRKRPNAAAGKRRGAVITNIDAAIRIAPMATIGVIDREGSKTW